MLSGVYFFVNSCMMLSHAQQTIFNVPSADITPKGALYVEHESQFRVWEHHKFWTGTHYFAYGLGHNSEIDITQTNLNSPDPSNTLAIGLGGRSVIPLFKPKYPDSELKWTIGGEVPVFLKKSGMGVWTYSHLSMRIPKLKTRLTGGVSYGTNPVFGRAAVAFIGGIEQPVSKRVSVITDWYSGTHNLGLWTVGGSLQLSKSTALFLGWQIPNNSQSGYSGLVIEFAKLF